jgi:hypothetical protein
MEDTTDRPSYEPELTEPPAPTAHAKFSALQRLWMIFASPGDVFGDIGLKPTWILILALFVGLGIAVNLIALPHIDTEATLMDRLGDRAEGLSEAQIDNMVEQAEKIGKLTPLFALVIGPIAWAIMAGVFFLMIKMLGSDADYQRTMSTVLHAYWPGSVVQSVLMVALLQRVGRIPQDELTNVVKASVGAFLAADTAPWLKAIADSISVFNIWAVVLLVVGLRIVGRLSQGKALTAALVPWAIYLAAKAGFVGLFN